MSQLTLIEVEKALQSINFSYEHQKETGQLYSLIEIDGKQFPFFFRLFSETNFLQVIAFFPYELKQEAAADTARLLHLFNKELDMPGFGMDEEAHVLFFRSMIPTPAGKASPKLIEKYIEATKNACQAFFNAVYAVASGSSTYADLYKRAKEKMQEAQKNTTT